jgi:peptidoglycan glycosyltransferase
VSRWKILLAALPGLVALVAAGRFVYLGYRTVRAMFLPYNFQIGLHYVEVGLLVFLGLLLLWMALSRGTRATPWLRLPDGREEPLRRAVTVGSGAEADVVVAGSPVSRRHLRLTPAADGGVEAVDLGSTNGTFRGDEDLRGGAGVVLRPGDRLGLGRGGPTVEVVERVAGGRWCRRSGTAALLLFLWSGLFLGWRANLDRLPAQATAVGQVSVDFTLFRDGWTVLALAAAATLSILALAAAGRRRPGTATTIFALALFLTVGVVVLYPLLPASGLRYAQAAVRALDDVGAESWRQLEEEALSLTLSRNGRGDRTPALLPEPIGTSPAVGAGSQGWAAAPSPVAGEGRGEGFEGRAVAPSPVAGEGRGEGSEGRGEGSEGRGEGSEGRGGDLGREAEERFHQGRAALRWAANLGALQGDPWYRVTYFRQVAVLLAAVFLTLAVPLRWRWLRLRIERLPDVLPRPVSRRLVRAADRGGLWALLLRPVAYWDVLFGFLAAAVVAVTLWTPLGSTQGRGKSLYLNLPGIATVQSVEIVKALFVLFMAGYFARHGAVLAKAPRRRYLVPYLLAVLMTLALTGVQADLGGLFMLGLFLALVFIAATGSFRMVASVPFLVSPAIVLAWLLGMTSIISTRFAIWSSPRTHPLGEQIVQARQLFLSSGWSGWAPFEARSWLLPDVQGDLVVAALAERYGFLGLAALIAGWFAFGASLLASARRADRPRSILLASIAALVLVQVLTQVAGAMGLLPLTGVPVPWISHGLTASLVFTLLAALAIHAVPADDSREGRGLRPPLPLRERAGVRVPGRGLRLPLPLRERAGVRGSHLRWVNGLACAAMAVAAAIWILYLPRQEDVGALGRDYRWENRARADELDGWIAAGLFVAASNGHALEVDAAAYERFRRAADDPGLLRLIAAADGLTPDEHGPRPRSYLITNPNRFADRSPPRGWIFSADGAALAMNDRRGRRVYPLGRAAFHPVGFGGATASAAGVEAAAAHLLRGDLRGESLEPEARRQAFWNDVHSGPELTLTLRSELQREAYRQLEGKRGAVVVMDLRDGALLALASAPAPEPGAASVGEWLRLARAADHPLRNRALDTTEVYSPPGSVFKIVVAATALTHRDAFDPRRKLRCRGYDPELRVSCAKGKAHGWVDLDRALTVSCNVYFANAAVGLGIDRLRDTATRFGFNGAATPDLVAGLPASRFVPGVSLAVATETQLRARDLARVGYGQGPVSATPLDVARMGAAIAGGGVAVEPYLARSFGYSRSGPDGLRRSAWQRQVFEPRRREVLPAAVAERLNRVLRGVFESPEGTARSLPRLWYGPDGWRLAKQDPGDGWRQVPMAGKTGSAWKTKNDASDDAWMVVWAPADAPRVLAAVLVEDAGEGGKVAGPVAVAMLRDALELLTGNPSTTGVTHAAG